MEELKTLKDFRTRSVMVYNCPDETDYDIVEADKLKQEAIKHAKSLSERAKGKNEIHTPQFFVNQQCYWNQLAWIMDFFNITEGDIKQMKKKILLRKN